MVFTDTGVSELVDSFLTSPGVSLTCKYMRVSMGLRISG